MYLYRNIVIIEEVSAVQMWGFKSKGKNTWDTSNGSIVSSTRKNKTQIEFTVWLKCTIISIFALMPMYHFQDTHFQTVMRGFLRGTLYCALWYGSIVAGFLLIACPLLPLLLLSPPRFRRCGDLLFSCWELYPTVSTAKYLTIVRIIRDLRSRSRKRIELLQNHFINGYFLSIFTDLLNVSKTVFSLMLHFTLLFLLLLFIRRHRQ